MASIGWTLMNCWNLLQLFVFIGIWLLPLALVKITSLRPKTKRRTPLVECFNYGVDNYDGQDWIKLSAAQAKWLVLVKLRTMAPRTKRDARLGPFSPFTVYYLLKRLHQLRGCVALLRRVAHPSAVVAVVVDAVVFRSWIFAFSYWVKKKKKKKRGIIYSPL